MDCKTFDVSWHLITIQTDRNICFLLLFLVALTLWMKKMSVCFYHFVIDANTSRCWYLSEEDKSIIVCNHHYSPNEYFFLAVRFVKICSLFSVSIILVCQLLLFSCCNGYPYHFMCATFLHYHCFSSINLSRLPPLVRVLRWHLPHPLFSQSLSADRQSSSSPQYHPLQYCMSFDGIITRLHWCCKSSDAPHES